MFLCKTCNKIFKSHSGLSSHIKIHPEYAEKYKKLIISLFNTDLSGVYIHKKYKIPFRVSWINEVWRIKFGKKECYKRMCKINKLSLIK